MSVARRPTKRFDQPKLHQWAVINAGHAKEYTKSVVRAGNEPPTIDIDIREGNTMFFFPNKPIQYAVRVVDPEDGSLVDGRISPDRVTVRIEYMSTRFDSLTALAKPRDIGETPTQALAQRLIVENDCRACHSINKPGVGPAYERIAQKYKGDSSAVDRLARKIISGGKGVWGDATMSPHPQLSPDNASTLVTYILSLSEARSPATALPVYGSYTPTIPETDNNRGYFRILASYTDRGTQSEGPIRAEKVRFLRSPVLLPQEADRVQQADASFPQHQYVNGTNAYWRYAQLDMTDISQLTIEVTALDKQTIQTGIVEVRSGSITGKLIGRTAFDTARLFPAADTSSHQKGNILVDLSPTLGISDIVFVLISPQASTPKPQIRIDAFVLN
ncbi:hypothetical protein GCM10028773_24850 [Spirosoma koreense]